MSWCYNHTAALGNINQDVKTTASPTWIQPSVHEISEEYASNHMIIRMSAPQAAIPAGFPVTINFDTVFEGTLGTLNAGTFKWTCPANGIYHMQLRVLETAPQDGIGDRTLGFYTAVIGDYELNHHRAAFVATGIYEYSISATLYLNAGAIMNCIFQHNAGAAATIAGCQWSIYRIAVTH